MISEVYFTNMTSNNPNDSLLLKLERLYERTGSGSSRITWQNQDK